MARLKTTVTTLPVCVFYDARHILRVDVSVAQMFDCSHSFLHFLPQILVLSVGGLLSSSSYCLVPMSCETGSWPDHRFNNTLWYTRTFPPSTRTGKWYPKMEPQSLTLGVWVPFSLDYPLDLDGISFKVRKKAHSAPMSHNSNSNDKCWWNIFLQIHL